MVELLVDAKNNYMKLKYRITENECWECTSHCTNSEGYVKVTHNGKQSYGHRYMYEKIYGKISSEVLRHTCDNRWCINPSHLIEGTHADNVKDRVERKRSAVGTANGRAKLSELDVIDIFIDNITPKNTLAKRYNVDPKVIRDIKNGKTWVTVTSKI